MQAPRLIQVRAMPLTRRAIDWPQIKPHETLSNHKVMARIARMRVLIHYSNQAWQPLGFFVRA